MAHYDLKQVLAAVRARKVSAARGSALDMYRQRMGYFSSDRERVRKEILEGLAKLQAQNFCQTVWIKDDESGEKVPYDVYGLPGYRGWDWYVKFRLKEDGSVYNLSFHLPLHSMTSAVTGKVVCEKAEVQIMDKEDK